MGAADLYAQSSTDLGDLMRRGDVYLDPETREVYTGNATICQFRILTQ